MAIIPDHVYAPPAKESPADHSVLTRDEWHYLGKTFISWLVGGALLVALVMTLQIAIALRQFGAQEYLARFVLLDVVFARGGDLVIVAASNTLVMLTHRRAKAAMTQPIRSVSWWIPIALGLLTPIAMTLIFGSSLAITTYGIGVDSSEAWKRIQWSRQWADFIASILSVIVVGALLVTLVPHLMRLLFRIRGWVLLKCILLSQVMGLVLHAVRLVWRAIVSY